MKYQLICSHSNHLKEEEREKKNSNQKYVHVCEYTLIQTQSWWLLIHKYKKTWIKKNHTPIKTIFTVKTSKRGDPRHYLSPIENHDSLKHVWSMIIQNKN